MNFNFGNSITLLIAGLMVVIIGVVFNMKSESIGNPVIFGGLALAFIGSICVVLSLNHRRRRNK
ncbi:hypothetical protein [Dyadobacter tibetensis]|uniref:hypothetical protein n=1 Tax=Dyadobacter tibetensis TaxID=1211851 RepID=UPI0004720EFD|nr:hypothetical protein [Dyadobacter tibetensis]